LKKELIKITCKSLTQIDIKQVIPSRSFYLCFKELCQQNFAKFNKKYSKRLKFVNQKQIEDILPELKELIGGHNAN
jgi:hypothetical protein